MALPLETLVTCGLDLVAICLQSGREKDCQRVRVFREQAELDHDYLAAVLARRGLETKWKSWTT